MSTSALEGHGLLGTREQAFTRLLPPNPRPFDNTKLDALAATMIIADEDLKDGADAEENLALPAGYTYFGQFIDHDLTLDTTSSLSRPDAAASNTRTPALDLDCLYGSGPDDQPYMYAADGASLLPSDPLASDLCRLPSGNPDYGRAVIGDKRNDENSIVCQIQLAMIKFHNAVVRQLKSQGFDKHKLFERARQEVTWTYQRIVIEDYLHRLTNTHTYDFFMQRRASMGEGAYTLYQHPKRSNLPKEFVGAAYRFGHSMVRTGYRLNTVTKKFIFDGSDLTTDSLIGFQPLPFGHRIDDWGRFFSADAAVPVLNGPPAVDNNPAVRLQWAYKMDPSLVLALQRLPPSIADGASLAALNLKRGNLPTYAIATGQAFAAALGEAPLPAGDLQVRKKTPDGGFTFESIGDVDARFLTETPLWFYILAEAQVPTLKLWRDMNPARNLQDGDFMSGPASQSRLGPVGGRILLEVFNGLVDEDTRSFRGPKAAGWRPMIGDKLTFWHLLRFAGLV
jgi:hypothetical protein